MSLDAMAGTGEFPFRDGTSRVRRICSRSPSVTSRRRARVRAPPFMPNPRWSRRPRRNSKTPEKMIVATSAALRRLSLGPLRHPRAAPELSVRRHGEPAHDVRDADCDRRRQEPDLARRARACALVVGQPRHELELEGHLAQRRLHQLRREPHRRGRATAASSPTWKT